ncbi:MAG: hypothetical protein ACRBB6_00060 [Neptuniibacter sp.]
MNSVKFFNLLLLGGILSITSGCDSSYHSYNGNTGFNFQPLSTDSYSLQYYGANNNSIQDVEVMWHHAAREICRGAGYQHTFTAADAVKEHSNLGNELIPKAPTRYALQGKITCLAPNIALKRTQEGLFGDDFATDNFISRHTSD